MAKNKPAGGRPQGAKTLDRAPALCLPPRCPKCGSTNRAPYRDGPLRETRGLTGDIDGHLYNRVVWRQTYCLDCKQGLTVREYHYDPPGEKSKGDATDGDSAPT